MLYIATACEKAILVANLFRNGRKLPPNLMKDAILLMDRAHSGRPSLPARPDRHRGSDLSRPATSTASVRHCS